MKLHAIVDACHSGSVMDLPFSAMSYNGVPQWRSEYQWQPRAHKVPLGSSWILAGKVEGGRRWMILERYALAVRVRMQTSQAGS